MSTPYISAIVKVPFALPETEVGQIIQADDFPGLIDKLNPGYAGLKEDGERLLSRMISMAAIVARFQSALIMTSGIEDELPEWFLERDPIDPIDPSRTWERPECPLALIVDAQAGKDLPKGTIIPFSVADELLFVKSLAKAGIIEVYFAKNEPRQQ